MRIFVAGSTGVLGRRLLPLLVTAGHDVSAACRSDAKAGLAASLGAKPVPLDLFDRDAVSAAAAGHDVVMNLATHIPEARRMARPSAWRENDQLRTVAAAWLADAALAGGARFVQESITFIYRDGGDGWLDEDSPLEATGPLASALVAEAHARRVSEGGGQSVVLRFATFYGPEGHTTDTTRSLARRGLLAGFGPDTYVSSIWLDDAARAVVAALEVAPGTYNVADDEPVTRRRYAEALAAALGVRRVRVPPRAVGHLLGPSASVVVRSQRVANRRLTEASGWVPEVRCVTEGWALAAGGAPGARRARG